MIVGQQSDGRWCPQIFALFSGLNPQGQLPEPHIWAASLNYLLRHNYRTNELLALLPHAGRTEIGEAVLIALERAPEHALLLIRKGSLASVPMDRTVVAAIHVLIGKPWCTQELLRALQKSDDQERTADARAAILELGDAEAEKAVLEWEQENPHEDEVGSYLEINGRKLGPFYSVGEHALKNRATWIHYEMDRLHDRVMMVRNVIPVDAP